MNGGRKVIEECFSRCLLRHPRGPPGQRAALSPPHHQRWYDVVPRGRWPRGWMTYLSPILETACFTHPFPAFPVWRLPSSGPFCTHRRSIAASCPAFDCEPALHARRFLVLSRPRPPKLRMATIVAVPKLPHILAQNVRQAHFRKKR